ncbi:hypothetical protein [Streptomyces violaceusniger]|uniref:hypothetical protein n=1 Tax=Streptomyces violaceusniger TaxID=68280 RepID=UPI0036792058
MERSSWLPPADWGSPLVVTEADEVVGRVNGERVLWSELTPRECRRLVRPDGGSMLLAVQSDGSRFRDWPTVFKRTSERIRDRFDPRFPHRAPHRCRHTFAVRTLEMLIGGYYAQAAKLVKDTDADAALALYLRKNDPVMILRDLLGHTSTLTTEVYLNPRELHQTGEKSQVASSAVAHAQRWAASPITELDEALEWIRLLGLGGLDTALRLRRKGVTPAMEKTRRESEEQARRDARAAEDRVWAEIAARYRPGIAAQLRFNGCTPDMLDHVINGKTADQLLREGRPVQIVINALRDTHG